MRNLFWQCMLLSTLIGGVSPVMAAVADYPFRLVVREAGAGHQVFAENNGPAPIAIDVSLAGKNLASDRNWPLTTVVPPYTVLPLGRVYPEDRAARGYDFRFGYSYHFGRFDAVHDAGATYRFPFENGRGFAITQAYGGTLTTHANRPIMHAVDFAMPVGSAVTAARAGVVIDVTLRHREGGDDVSFIDKANSVAIVHDDGTVAEYAHLSPGPAAVAVGQRVAAGDLLGYSGNTGYASGPHLHFIVSRPRLVDGKVTLVSVPVLFYTSDPAVRFSAQTGMIAWANYGRTVSPNMQRAARSSASPQSPL